MFSRLTLALDSRFTPGGLGAWSGMAEIKHRSIVYKLSDLLIMLYHSVTYFMYILKCVTIGFVILNSVSIYIYKTYIFKTFLSNSHWFIHLSNFKRLSLVVYIFVDSGCQYLQIKKYLSYVEFKTSTVREKKNNGKSH